MLHDVEETYGIVSQGLAVIGAFTAVPKGSYTTRVDWTGVSLHRVVPYCKSQQVLPDGGCHSDKAQASRSEKRLRLASDHGTGWDSGQ